MRGAARVGVSSDRRSVLRRSLFRRWPLRRSIMRIGSVDRETLTNHLCRLALQGPRPSNVGTRTPQGARRVQRKPGGETDRGADNGQRTTDNKVATHRHVTVALPIRFFCRACVSLKSDGVFGFSPAPVFADVVAGSMFCSPATILQRCRRSSSRLRCSIRCLATVQTG